MKKLFTLLCTLLLAVQFAAAQNPFFVRHRGGDHGKMSVYPSITAIYFSDDDDLFTFKVTTNAVENLTAESFRASVRADLVSEKFRNIKQPLEVGVCYSATKDVPTVDDSCKVLGKKTVVKLNFTISSLSPGVTYKYRGWAKMNDRVYYGDVVKVKLPSLEPGETIINGHKFIDLGLPSGLLWAETNVGAETATDYGNYYAWGETTTKSEYPYEDKYNSYDAPTKYNKTDSLTVLENSDDVAYVTWGSGCSMPTYADLKELVKFCTWTWDSIATSSGTTVVGYTVASKSNENSIFLPFAGYWDRDELFIYDNMGTYYRSKELYRPGDHAWVLLIEPTSTPSVTTRGFRYLGCVVRPVARP